MWLWWMDLSNYGDYLLGYMYFWHIFKFITVNYSWIKFILYANGIPFRFFYHLPSQECFNLLYKAIDWFHSIFVNVFGVVFACFLGHFMHDLEIDEMERKGTHLTFVPWICFLFPHAQLNTKDLGCTWGTHLTFVPWIYFLFPHGQLNTKIWVALVGH